MPWGLDLEGFPELIATFEGLAEKATKASAAVLFAEANVIMTAAKEQTPVALPETYTPSQYKRLTPGALRASGHVGLPEIIGDQVFVELGFGDAAVDYAVYVHEILHYHHPVGKAKFLEDPVTQMGPTVIEKAGEAWLNAMEEA